MTKKMCLLQCIVHLIAYSMKHKEKILEIILVKLIHIYLLIENLLTLPSMLVLVTATIIILRMTILYLKKVIHLSENTFCLSICRITEILRRYLTISV